MSVHQMFNVSALLLDDEFKPATPLTNSATLDISQGSVATHLRRDGIFSDSIVTSFLLIQTVNNFENRLIFGKVKAYKMVPNFLGHPVMSSFLVHN